MPKLKEQENVDAFEERQRDALSSPKPAKRGVSRTTMTPQKADERETASIGSPISASKNLRIYLSFHQ